jgi:hypothetical protein
MIVTAYNSGREAATITSVFVRDTTSYRSRPVFLEPLPGSDPIPFRLQAGGHAQWHYEASVPKSNEDRVTVKVGLKKRIIAE